MVKIVVETKNSKLMLKLNCCEVHFVRIRGVHNDDTRKPYLTLPYLTFSDCQ